MGYTIALTGGIDSSKSVVADTFAQLGVSIVDADVVARQVVGPGTPTLQATTSRFGSQMVIPGGTLNHRLLREKVFAHVKGKARLNALLHPSIQQEARHQMQAATSPYLLWAAPLLVEDRLSGQADRILVVDMSEEAQIERTILRDRVNREHAEHILTAQVMREQRLAVTDDVIENTDIPDAVASDVARPREERLMLTSQAASQESS